MLLRYLKKALVFSAVAAGVFMFALSCENGFNPFSNNLGQKVDIAYPVTYVESPTPGSFLKGTVTFKGRATAYRDLASVEVTILDPTDQKNQRTLPGYGWKPVRLIDGENKTEKTWTYDLDTTTMAEDVLKIKFRATDTADLVEQSIVLRVYIIKNGPSIITMTNPDENHLYEFDTETKLKTAIKETPSLSGEIYTGSRLQGTIIDRRGIKPGYPRIKIWKVADPEPADWAVLFLSDVDDTGGSEELAASWAYGTKKDINTWPVENTVSFVFNLSQYTLEDDPRDTSRKIIKYTPDSNGKLIPFDIGLYRFKILTSDTFFDETPGPTNYFPRDPKAGEVEIKTHEPPLVLPALVVPEYNVDYHTIDVVLASSESARVRLDNSDLTTAQLAKKPNIYIESEGAEKIVVGPGDLAPSYNPALVDFRLRVNAYHTGGVHNTVLKWSHPSKGSGFLPWDDIGTDGYVDGADATTKAQKGHRGMAPPNNGAGRIFEFTGTHGAHGNIFTSSSEPYVLTVTAYLTAEQANPVYGWVSQDYYLYLDDGGPEISINDVKGRSVNREGNTAPLPGGTIHKSAYWVNDNIEVSTYNTANKGIREEDGKQVIKWFLVESNGTDPDLDSNSAVLLNRIKQFRSNPTGDGFLTYFNSDDKITIVDRGTVESVSTTQGRFKLSVVKRDTPNGPNTLNGKDLWLYVVAQDGLYNLGYTVQKLHVDDDGDKPKLQITGLDIVGEDGSKVNLLSDLHVAIADEGGVPTANKTPVNVLGTAQPIELSSLVDDDGIKPSDIEIKLTAHNLNREATILGTDITGMGTAVFQEWNGTLTQALMAQKLGLSGQLPDGLYTIEFTIPDDLASKVGPPPDTLPTPLVVTTTKTVHFAVHDTKPVITLDPTLNSINEGLLPPTTITLFGTVTSRFEIQRLDIFFSPDVIGATAIPHTATLPLYSNAAFTQTATPTPVNGVYTYYWRMQNVDFGNVHASVNDDTRYFSLTAWDRLGEPQVEERTVRRDTTAPRVEKLVFNFDRLDKSGQNEGQVNGKVPIEILAFDANGIGQDVYPTEAQPVVPPTTNMHIKWFALPQNGGVTTPPTWASAPSGRWGWFTVGDRRGEGRYRAFIDTRSWGEQRYDLYVIARDIAGNENVPTLPATLAPLVSFTVAQSTDIPELAFPEDPSPKNGAFIGGASAKLFITGNVYDDDGFDPLKTKPGYSNLTTAYVAIRFPTTVNSNNVVTAWSNTWYEVKNTEIDNITGNLKFTYDFTECTYVIGNGETRRYLSYDGNKHYQLRIQDEAARGAEILPVGSNNYNPEGKNPDGATTNLITRQTITLPSANGSYSFTLKNTNPTVYFNHYDPDLCHLVGHAHDNTHDHSSTHTNKRPTFKAQSELLAVVDGTAVLSGKIVDTSLRDAYFVYHTETTKHVLVAEGHAAPSDGETYIWTAQNAWLSGFGTAGSPADGEYRITIVATDTLGNETSTQWTFSKDTTPPVVTYDNINPNSAAPVNPATPRVISGAANDVFVTGQFNDRYSDIGTTFDYALNGAWTNSFNFVSNGGTIDGNYASWSVPIPGEYNGAFPDGRHTFNIRNVKDVLGNATAALANANAIPFYVDRRAPEMVTKSEGTGTADRIIVKGGAGMVGLPSSGYLPVNERVFSAASAKAASPSNPIPATDPANQNDSTGNAVVFTLSGLVYEHNLNSLRAFIRNVTDQIVSVNLTGIDNSAIAWRQSVAPPAGTWFYGRNSANTTDLTATENSLRVRRAQANDFGLSGSNAATYQNRYVWELDIRIKDMYALMYLNSAGIVVSGNALDSIARSIAITARDLANRDSDTEVWQFYLDSAPPVISFQELDPGVTKSFNYQSVTLNGSASDSTNIRLIQYKIDKKTNYAQADNLDGSWTLGAWTNYAPAGGMPASDRVSWALPPLTDQGYYRLSVRASDYSLSSAAGGNESAPAVALFYIDRANPAIPAAWITGAQAYYRWDASGKIVFNVGNVTDANTLNETLTGVLQHSGGLTHNIAVAVAAANPHAASTAVTVTLTKPVSPLTSPDGVYTLTLTIKDKAGNEANTNVALRFTLDNAPPVISVNDRKRESADSNNPLVIPEAITGRMVFKGGFTKASGTSPVTRVAYAVNTNAAPPTEKIFNTTTGGTNNNIQTGTRYFTYAGHGLAVGDTVIVDNISRYVLWVSGNNFKLSDNYIWPTDNVVWNPNTNNFTMNCGRNDAILRSNGWFFNDGGTNGGILRANAQGDPVVTGGTGDPLMEIDQGLPKADLLLYNTRRFNTIKNTPASSGSPLLGGTEPVVTGSTTPTFGGAAISGMTDKNVNKLILHLLAIDQAGNHSLESFTYWVYPAGDYPVVSAFTTPNGADPEESRLLNGAFKIAGAATDNYRVRQVWFRVLRERQDGTSSTAAGSIPANYQVTTFANAIPKWDTRWNAIETGTNSERYQDAQSKTFTHGAGLTETSGGWYIANRTTDSVMFPVSWWVEVNKNSELDPQGSNTSRKIIIQTLAEDTYWVDSANNYNESGNFLSVLKEVNATVVNGLPTFTNEQVRSAASNATETTINGWGSMLTNAIKERGAYKVIVRHTTGVSAIRWTNPVSALNASSYGFVTSSKNLLDITDVPSTGQWQAQLGAITDNGIAIKAEPLNVITATTLTIGDTYMVWDWNNTLNGNGGLPSSPANPAEQRYKVFKATAATNIGAARVQKQVADNQGNLNFEYQVTVDINSTTLTRQGFSDSFAGKAGTYSLNFEAYETSRTIPLLARKTAIVPIDNLAPTGEYTLSSKIVGISSFGGTATDKDADPADGTIAGLSRVVLWFSRDDAPFVWNQRVSGSGAFNNHYTSANPDNMAQPSGIANLPSSTLPYIPPEGFTGTNNSVIIIDRQDPAGNQPHHGHKLAMGWADGGPDTITWYVALNSENMISGQITAHFIVYDRAGNGTYYSQKLMVLNGIPIIRRITLGTDIYGSTTLDLQGTGGLASGTNNRAYGNGALSANGVTNANVFGTRNVNGVITANGLIRDRYNNGDVKTAGINADLNNDAEVGIAEVTVRPTYSVVYDQKDFMARNNLLAIKVETDVPRGGSGLTRNYRVEYVSDAVSKAGTAIEVGRVYIINTPGTDFPWGILGAQEPYQQGTAFLALLNGSELPTGNYGSPTAWELNSAYYDSVDGIPAALRFNGVSSGVRGDNDVTYANVADGGTSAEFVYGTNAFGAGKIVDFTPYLDSTGRPQPYPATTAADPWVANSLFIIRIFEGAEANLFGDFALLSVRVNNADQTPSYAQLYDINPKTESATGSTAATNSLSVGAAGEIGANRAKGGLYNSGSAAIIVREGHIEPRKTTSLTSGEMGGATSSGTATITRPYVNSAAFFDVDTVSGKVIVRGYAEDNQRIGQVDLVFTGTSATTVTILTSRSAVGGGTGAENKYFLQAATGANANGRVDFTETVDLNRHRVEWSYLWDTETVPASNFVVGNATVRAVAHNANTAYATGTTNRTSAPRTHANAASAAAGTNLAGTPVSWDDFNPDYYPATGGNFRRYNQIPINLRPYITGFKRNKTLFAHDTRSRQGRYMFARGETAVVTGFNLGLSGSTTTIFLPGVTNGTTAAAFTAADSDYELGVSGTPSAVKFRTFTVDDAAATNNNVATNFTTNGNGTVRLRVTRSSTDYWAANTGADRPRVTIGTTANISSRPAVQPWNMERNTASASALWDDFTSVHIWVSDDANGSSNDRGRFPASAGFNIMNPAMSIDHANGDLYASHNEGGSGHGSAGTTGVNATTQRNEGTGSYYNSGTLRLGSNTNTAATNMINVAQFRDPIIMSDIYRSPGGTGAATAGTWAAFSVIGRSGTSEYPNGLGGIYIYGPDGTYFPFIIGASSTDNNNNPYLNRSLYAVESTWYNASGQTGSNTTGTTDQFMNPHIVTYASGATEHIHVAYHDNKDGSIKYRYNLRGAPNRNLGTGNTIAAGMSLNDYGGQASTSTSTATMNALRQWVNLDGGSDSDDQIIVTNASRSTNAGEHNAIAVTSQGYPVVAYFDQSGQRLRLAVSNNVAPTAASNWKIFDSVSSSGIGEYVSMKIDTRSGTNQNRVHIAAFNSAAKRLVYITGTLSINTTNAANSTFTGVTEQVVDSFGDVGRWCSLSLDTDGNPWISYQDEGYRGSRDGVKVAYKNTTTFYKGVTQTSGASFFAGKDMDTNGIPIEGWEAMHVPTRYRVNDARLGMENFPTRNVTTTSSKFWTGAVSYLAPDYYRIAYYVK